jgi:hypothetical protein
MLRRNSTSRCSGATRVAEEGVMEWQRIGNGSREIGSGVVDEDLM